MNKEIKTNENELFKICLFFLFFGIAIGMLISLVIIQILLLIFT